MESSQPERNVIQYSEVLQPGKHYFYYIYDRKNIFLSPSYDIVRYKGTNVFLNMVDVKPRDQPLDHIRLPRKYVKQTTEFTKDMSVFAGFQDDTPEYLYRLVR